MTAVDATEPVTTCHALMRRLAEHAKTLGWEIVEWDWKDTDGEGYAEYQMWVQPLTEEQR